MELEKLLNKLIEKGWQPFGWLYYDRFIIESDWDMCFRWKYPWTDWESAFDYNYDYFKIRELVSKESWLWQFVCQNDLYPPYIQHRWFRDRPENWLQIHDYRYWLIESALREELELERFLLDNIKV